MPGMNGTNITKVFNTLMKIIQNPNNYVVVLTGGIAMVFDHKPDETKFESYYKDWKSIYRWNEKKNTANALLIFDMHDRNVSAFLNNDRKFIYGFTDEQWNKLVEELEQAPYDRKKREDKKEVKAALDFMDKLLEANEKKFEKIRAASAKVKKKGVSGVVIADKIANMMRSGAVKGDITPAKGKQLREQIMKKLNSKGRK